MELGSGRRRLRRSPPPDGDRFRRQRGHGGGADRISNLSDDMLRLVLARLRCIRTTVRTGLLSRRWRGLWTSLAHTDLVFDDVAPATVKAAFARFAASSPAPVSTVDIRLPTTCECPKQVNALLRAAMAFSPAELVVILPYSFAECPFMDIELPCFPRTTSIELDAVSTRITPTPMGDFTTLQSLSLRGKIDNLGAILDRCPCLRVLAVAFRLVDSALVESALASIDVMRPRLTVSLLDISIPRQDIINAARFASLIHAAARISPQEFVFSNFNQHVRGVRNLINAHLPWFHRATSIVLSLHNICFTQLPDHNFSTLEMLSLSACSIINLPTLVTHCPRLRVLKVIAGKSTRNITIHSTSLQELDVRAYMECSSIDIVTPVLKQLKLGVRANTDLSMYISTPMVENISFQRYYTGFPLVFDCSLPEGIRLETLPTNNGKDISSHLPPVYVLILHMSACNHVGAQLDFTQEMDKLLFINFSVLELHLTSMEHVSGGLLSRLLEMYHVQTATQRLKVNLHYYHGERKACGNCPCNEPKNRIIQSISMPHLKEVEICGFKGEHCQLDLLTLICRCAPILKTMTVKLTKGVNRENIRGGIRKIYNIFLAYPSVDCYAYFYSGEPVRRAHG